MDATATYEELRSFWQTAYASLDPEPGSRQGGRLQATIEQWASGVLAADGVSATSPTRKLFSLKPPEPFFGNWRSTSGGLSVAGKTIVALINPGDGIGFTHCADPHISLVGRPHWALLKEFYTKGSVFHDGSAHTLLYKRGLMNPNYDYRHGTRTFGWGWWCSQWANMLRAMGETRSEEECFLTIELFAYSSPSAGRLSADVLSVLRSSDLVVRLLAELVQQPQETGPRRIVLVNKRAVWHPALNKYGIDFEALPPRNRAGAAIAFRGRLRGRRTPVPLLLLNGAQGMKFPQRPDVTPVIFEAS